MDKYSTKACKDITSLLMRSLSHKWIDRNTFESKVEQYTLQFKRIARGWVYQVDVSIKIDDEFHRLFYNVGGVTNDLMKAFDNGMDISKDNQRTDFDETDTKLVEICKALFNK